MPALRAHELQEITEYLFHEHHHSLQPHQWKELTEATEEGGSTILKLHLLCDEAFKWRSYQSQVKLPRDVRAIIGTIFDRVEDVHGLMLVSRCVGYLAASILFDI